MKLRICLLWNLIKKKLEKHITMYYSTKNDLSKAKNLSRKINIQRNKTTKYQERKRVIVVLCLVVTQGWKILNVQLIFRFMQCNGSYCSCQRLWLRRNLEFKKMKKLPLCLIWYPYPPCFDYLLHKINNLSKKLSIFNSLTMHRVYFVPKAGYFDTFGNFATFAVIFYI